MNKMSMLQAEGLKSSLSFSPNTSKVKNCYAPPSLSLSLTFCKKLVITLGARKHLNNRHQSDLIHYQTGNRLRHASGPVHLTIPPVTFIITKLLKTSWIIIVIRQNIFCSCCHVWPNFFNSFNFLSIMKLNCRSVYMRFFLSVYLSLFKSVSYCPFNSLGLFIWKTDWERECMLPVK